MSQKVSIVVPIYNVEKYLNRCVDSILNQSYKNIEVILVDDGSPDNCGIISEQYAKQDHRVKVIHKANGGLSDARNFGMNEVTGEFTLFVDSDDWLDTNMIDIMINEIKSSNADVVQVAFYYAYNNYLLYDDRYYSEKMEPIYLDNKELMRELVINERVKNFAWGKLYKTSIIKDINFKKGALFEDVFWAHQVMKRVNKYSILHKPLCYYFQREDSIVSKYSVRNLDILKGLKERHKFIEKYYKNLTDESFNIITKTSLLHYNLLFMNKDKDKKGLYRKEIRNYIIDNYDSIFEAVKQDKEFKIQLSLFKIYGPLNLLVIIKNKALRIIGLKKSESGLKKILLENR